MEYLFLSSASVLVDRVAPYRPAISHVLRSAPRAGSPIDALTTLFDAAAAEDKHHRHG